MNQDAFWVSPDGRLAIVADGGARPDQHAELASTTCCRVAGDLYTPESGDDLIERIVRESNHELVRRVAKGDAVGTTGLSIVHFSASGVVLGAALRDSPLLHARDGRLLRRVRPTRKYDFLATDSAERASFDHTFASLHWKLRIPLEYHLPYADLTLGPAVERFDYQEGDTLVVCTDGVSDVLDVGELIRGDDAAILVALATQRGSGDDATCLVLTATV